MPVTYCQYVDARVTASVLPMPEGNLDVEDQVIRRLTEEHFQCSLRRPCQPRDLYFASIQRRHHHRELCVTCRLIDFPRWRFDWKYDSP